MGNSCEKLECIDFSVGPSARRSKRGRAQFRGELTLHEHLFTGASGIDGEVLLTVTSPMVELKGLYFLEKISNKIDRRFYLLES